MISKQEIKDNISYRAFYETYFGGLPETKTGGWTRKNILCPFHDDKNPSFGLNLDTGAFCCFSCNETGDVFSFVQKKHGFSFFEAVSFLGDFCGLASRPFKRDEVQAEIESRKMQDMALKRFEDFERRRKESRLDLFLKIRKLISLYQDIDPLHDRLRDLYFWHERIEHEIDEAPEIYYSKKQRLEIYRESNGKSSFARRNPGNRAAIQK